MEMTREQQLARERELCAEMRRLGVSQTEISNAGDSIQDSEEFIAWAEGRIVLAHQMGSGRWPK